jgi:hypothetical protein
MAAQNWGGKKDLYLIEYIEVSDPLNLPAAGS